MEIMTESALETEFRLLHDQVSTQACAALLTIFFRVVLQTPKSPVLLVSHLQFVMPNRHMRNSAANQLP